MELINMSPAIPILQKGILATTIKTVIKTVILLSNPKSIRRVSEGTCVQCPYFHGYKC